MVKTVAVSAGTSAEIAGANATRTTGTCGRAKVGAAITAPAVAAQGWEKAEAPANGAAVAWVAAEAMAAREAMAASAAALMAEAKPATDMAADMAEAAAWDWVAWASAAALMAARRVVDMSGARLGPAAKAGAAMAATKAAAAIPARATRAQGGYTGQGYTGQGYGDRDRDYGRSDDRGFIERASDEVASWFGDEDAERRRRMDEQGEHRGRGPKGYARSDDRIREEICDRLTDDPMIDASEVEVTVSSGEVTLAGTVDRREIRRRAEDLAERISGVNHVQNNLRVRQGSTGASQSGASAMGGAGSGRSGSGTSSTGSTSSSGSIFGSASSNGSSGASTGSTGGSYTGTGGSSSSSEGTKGVSGS